MSTTFDCWKYSCQGATVVPTMAKISSAPFEVRPPSMPGSTNPLSAAPGSGWLRTRRGSASRLANRKTNIARSQRRKLPLSVIPISSSVAIGTAKYLLMPKYSAARPTPMNSVLMTRKLSRKRPATEYQPQKRPNRSAISLARPTPVTAPRRTTISWFTISTGTRRISVQSSE